MPTICSETQRIKRRRAALTRLGETPAGVPSDPSAGFSVMAAIKGRVNWKIFVAMLVSGVLMRERGMGI